MDLAWNVFAFMAGCTSLFLLGGLWAFYKAIKTKTRVYYFLGVSCCFVSTVFIALALGQFLLSCIISVGAALLLLPMMPKLIAANTVDVDGALGPLRVKDIFSLFFIPKLERTYGDFRARIIYTVVNTGIGAIINLLLAMLNIITLPIAGVLTIAVFAICVGTYDYQKEGRPDRKF